MNFHTVSESGGRRDTEQLIRFDRMMCVCSLQPHMFAAFSGALTLILHQKLNP